jgi:NADPH:quinone reductase-like Zn-dependent oxidoreductase
LRQGTETIRIPAFYRDSRAAGRCAAWRLDALSSSGLSGYRRRMTVMPLAEAADAHRLLENRAAFGKIVLEPGQSVSSSSRFAAALTAMP